MKDVSLVLEGGGMRGVYTAGVLDFFIDVNFYPSYCIGVSAGACQGASYIAKQYQRNYRININYIRDKRYLSLRNLITTGSLFGMDMLFNKIPNELEPFDYDTFKASDILFKVGVTDCETGLSNYYQIDDFKDNYSPLTASVSLPLVAPIVKHQGKKLLDGGIADPIPIRQAIKDGNKKHIVVLTQHKGYQKSKVKELMLIKRKYKQYPKLIEAMEKRHDVYNHTLAFLDELEEKKLCYIIRPSTPLCIGRFERNPEKLKEVYRKGYEDAKKEYLQLKEFIKSTIQY